MSEYIFTFGFAHEHPDTGEPLRNCYVVIRANTSEEAREQMFARFGRKWSMQYRSREAAGVEKYHLREIP